MEYTKNDTKALEEEVERIRARRRKKFDTEKVRSVLNTLFLVLALAGIVMYYVLDQGDDHTTALAVIGVGMLLKIAEFVIRFMF